MADLRSPNNRGILGAALLAGLVTYVFGQQVIVLLGPGSRLSPSLLSTYGITVGIPDIAALPLSLVLALVMISFVFMRLLDLSHGNHNPDQTGKKMQRVAVIAALPFVVFSIFQLAFLIENDKSWYFGTAFLWENVGFDIRNPWPYESDLAAARSKYYIIGIISAVRVVIISIFLCTIIGIFAGVMRLSRNKVVSSLATAYVEFFRNLPLVVQLFFWYAGVLLALPMLTDRKTAAFGWMEFSSQGVVLPGFTVLDFTMLCLVIAVPMSVRIARRYITRSEPRGDISSNISIKRPLAPLGWKQEALLADIILLVSTLLFIFLIFEFWTYGPISFLVGFLAFLYSIYLTFNLNNVGVNDFEIDETQEGLRKRAMIWIPTLLITAYLIAQAITIPVSYTHLTLPTSDLV